jgi:hypothetical protein
MVRRHANSLLSAANRARGELRFLSPGAMESQEKRAPCAVTATTPAPAGHAGGAVRRAMTGAGRAGQSLARTVDQLGRAATIRTAR